jgi:heme exporter protein D
LPAGTEIEEMGRRYAGILGLLAFATVLGHGVMHGGHAETTLPLACGLMFVFAAVGATVGSLAGWIVADAVRTKLILQLAESASDEKRRAQSANGNPA